MNTLKIFIAVIFLLGKISFIKADITIIPCPMETISDKGNYTLDCKTPVISSPNTLKEAEYLASVLGKGFGQNAAIKSSGKGIKLSINPILKETLGQEGYILFSNKKEIKIEGATSAGLFYGIQSLRQLLPADFEFSSQKDRIVSVPCLKIRDKPRFQWRAFMLDESRHFKGMDVVKNLLDQMALLKMNTFHWHLTDDQGWRIEIKKYPNLTKTGANRKDTQTKRRSTERTGVSHGGFYTQDQIKEIIQYADSRHIQIIPEIEMPGHATAAIAAYPWLGVLGTTTEVSVVFGKMEDSFNVADPKVYQFLEDVLTEVFELFPGKIVHIGGDEVMFDTWKNSVMIQDLIKNENLSSPADLQIFFTNRMSNFIDSHKHRMMGWNEILGVNVHEWHNDSDLVVKQELAKSAIIHFWKGNLELINSAVSKGYDIVNSFHSQTYLDYDYKTIPLVKTYEFDPIPEGLEEKYHNKILGLGCQMWSEWIPTVSKMEKQIFPRIAAYAEVGWTPKNRMNFNNFSLSLNELKKRWKLYGINYYEEKE